MADGVRSQDIQAVVRATEVLRLVSERGSVGVKDVSALMGLDRTTAHRYLNTLLKVGFLSRVRDGQDSGNYRLGPFASIIGGAVEAGQGVLAAASEALQGIADHLRTTMVVSSVSNHGVVVAEVRYPAGQRLSIRMPVGYRVPVDGVQSIVALAHEPPAVVESILDSAQANEGIDRAAVVAQLERAHADGGLIATASEGIEVVTVPLFQDGKVVATLAALAFPGDDAWAAATLKHLLARSRELSRPALS